MSKIDVIYYLLVDKVVKLRGERYNRDEEVKRMPSNHIGDFRKLDLNNHPLQQLTKHDLIMQYIEGLPIGTRISVRTIAKELDVSEGTAYKAFKDAEAVGLVSTKERVGTVRIDRKRRERIQQLTYREVAEIVEGSLYGGLEGLQKSLHKFVIGAMELDAMLNYIDQGSLLIVGNRANVYEHALEKGAGVLITGGFEPEEHTIALADRLALPIISTRHDSYTVASMINRAMYDRLIRRKIILLEDIVTFTKPADVMKQGQTVGEFHQLFAKTGAAKFPVLDERNRVIGMMTAKDAVGVEDDVAVDKVMSKHPITAAPNITVTSAVHTMSLEGIDLLPVVDRHRRLLTVVTKQEVFEALRFTGKQAESGDTFEDQIWTSYLIDTQINQEQASITYSGKISPQMSGALGMASEGLLTTLMTQAARKMIRELNKRDFLLEHLNNYFLKPISIESKVKIEAKPLELSRMVTKIELSIFTEQGLAAKGLLTAQIIDP